MNIRISYVVQILLITFLRSYAYKLSYINKLYFHKKNNTIRNVNYLIKFTNLKNVSHFPLKNKKNYLNLLKLGVNNWEDNSRNNGNKNARNVRDNKNTRAKCSIECFECPSKSSNLEQPNRIDLTHIFYKEKKYSFFKPSECALYYIHTDKYKSSIIYQKNVLAKLAIYSAQNLFFFNIFLEIIKIIENTLRNKIYYINIKEEFNKKKDAIIDMLHDIYKDKYLNTIYEKRKKCSNNNDNKINLLFIGSNEFSSLCFKIILLIIKVLRNDIVIENVITKSPQKKGRHLLINKSPVEEEAKKNKINVFYYDKLKNNIHLLKNKQFNLGVSISFGEIFNTKFFKTINTNIYTLHPSLLPSYKGASPIQRSLLNNESLFGYTIFLTKLKIDSGASLIKKRFLFSPYFNFNDIITIMFTFGTLHFMKNIFFLSNLKLHQPESTSLSQTDTDTKHLEQKYDPHTYYYTNQNDKNINLRKRDKIENLFLFPYSQSNQFENSTNLSQKSLNSNNVPYEYYTNNCYAPKIKVEEKYTCFFCFTSLYIHNKVRSFINWPKAECTLFLLHDNKIRKIEAKLIKTSYNLSNPQNDNIYDHTPFNTMDDHKCFDDIPRKYAIVDKECINILCKNNTLLKIYKLQRKNKKIMDAITFINSINRGSILY
ncbi:methionyl-tRNA formyltransferase, putative [Plasmodium chabaudi chabaudi]|uniref:Methionyl-tRNA formyltransferase, putative n=1 Tax=Plasmodium chabaudi chabaudi TaxID=31271 RepID=A0A1D3S2K2_PLACU|nr:methionyl-tRNA formyltransferase, putative [Plasmodium chabaudi chabaudi]